MRQAIALDIWPSRATPILVAGAMSAAAGVLVSAYNLSVEAFLFGAICAVAVGPIAYRLATGTFDIFEPLTVFCITFGVFYFLDPLVMWLDPVSVPKLVALYGINSEDYQLLLLVILVGGLGFLVGYAAPIGAGIAKVLPSPGDNPSTANTLLIGAFFVVAGLGAFLLWVIGAGGMPVLMDFLSGRSPEQRLLRLEGIDYLFRGLELMVPGTLLLFLMGARKRSLFILLIALTASFIILAWAIPNGRRTTMMFLLVPLFIFPYLRDGTRPNLAFAITALLAAIVVLSAIGVARSQAQREEAGTGLVQAFIEPVSQPVEMMNRIFDSGDAGMSANLALVLRSVPEDIPYGYGTYTIRDALTFPIPRAIWPDKPAIMKGRVTEMFWPGPVAAGTTSPAYGPLAWMYADWWLPGAFLGMFVYGFCFRAAFSYFRQHPHSFLVQILYATLIVTFMLAFKSDFVALAPRLAYVQLPLILAVLVLQRSPRSQHEEVLAE